ncbi:MAG TPA: hypothetical protein DDW71_00595 [Lactobacillus sp.]|nr:hypothetical protein [Lactobacillus sp.]
MKCELCNGSGRIYVETSWGVEVAPCPNCNEVVRANKQEAFELAAKAVKTPDWVREAVMNMLS